MKDTKNNRLVQLGFVASILVVMCHCDDVISSEHCKLVDFFGKYFSSGDVENFFCVSGYLLAKRCSEKDWWINAVRKRIASLGVPYVLWSIIGFSVMLILSLIMNGADGRGLKVLSGNLFGIREIFGLSFTEPPIGMFPLWYIKCLLMFVIVSPIVVYLLKLSRASIIAIILLCVFTKICIPYTTLWLEKFSMSGFDILSFAFFSAGMFFALYPVKIRVGKCIGILSLIIWVGCAAGLQHLETTSVCGGGG